MKNKRKVLLCFIVGLLGIVGSILSIQFFIDTKALLDTIIEAVSYAHPLERASELRSFFPELAKAAEARAVISFINTLQTVLIVIAIGVYARKIKKRDGALTPLVSEKMLLLFPIVGVLCMLGTLYEIKVVLPNVITENFSQFHLVFNGLIAHTNNVSTYLCLSSLTLSIGSLLLLIKKVSVRELNAFEELLLEQSVENESIE